MARGQGVSQTGRVTPNRVSHLIVDEDREVVVERAFQFTRSYKEINLASGSAPEIQYYNGIGFKRRPAQSRCSIEATGDNNIGVVSMTVPTNVVQVSLFDAITKGTYTTPTVAGNTFYQKRIPASATDMTSTIAADAQASPSPDVNAMEPMDRAGITTFVHSDDLKEFAFDFFLVSGKRGGHGPVFSVQFVGPASMVTMGSLTPSGTGHYCITIEASGHARLYQMTNTYGWVQHAQWMFGSHLDRDRPYRLVISYSIAIAHPALTFTLDYQLDTNARNVIANTVRFYNTYNADTTITDSQSYTIDLEWAYATNKGATPIVASEPIRININRNIRPLYRLIIPSYVTNLSMMDEPFQLDALVRGNTDILIIWKTGHPLVEDQYVDGKLYDAITNIELSNPVLINSHTKKYTLTPATVALQASFTIGGLRTYSPSLIGYSVQKSGRTDIVSPGSFEPENATNVNALPLSQLLNAEIVGQNGDSNFSHATFQVADITNNMTRLRTRGELAYRFETEYDPLDSSKRCILHRGKIIEPMRVHITGGGSTYGGNLKMYHLPGASMWAYITNKSSRVRETFTSDPAIPAVPWKVTDAIRFLLQWADVPPSMINIPDLPLRMWPAPSIGSFIAPMEPIGDLLVRLSQVYLGRRLMFMENWGSYGQWTLQPVPLPPYSNLAHFQTASSSAGKLGGYLPSYGKDAIDNAQNAFVEFGSLSDWQIPIQFNRLVVSAVQAVGKKEALMTQMWHNFKSFNFLGLNSSHPSFPSPNHPDYLSEVKEAVKVEPLLAGKGNDSRFLNWATRRYAQIGGYTKKGYRFKSQLVIVNDPQMPGAVRPLMFYDPVTLDGVQYLVRNVYIEIKSDFHQSAIYEVEAPRGDYL